MLFKLFFGRLRKCGLFVAFIMIIGTVGYAYIEGWPANDSFYMTVITMSTVGFSETRELSAVGRVFTTWLIFFSIAGMSIWTAGLTSLIVEGDLSGQFLMRKTAKMVAKMKGHTIVCGSNVMARTVVDELVRNNLPVVVVDDHTTRVNELRQLYPNVQIIQKSPTSELSLAEANVLTAKNVVAALDEEFDNLLISMTCKDIGTQINVFARSDDLQIAGRMKKAGADEVICPFLLSGTHVANQITG